MPSVDFVKTIKIERTFRVAQLCGMFDVPQTTESSEHFVCEVPSLNDDWNVGAIVGPSGSGKSCVAQEVYGDAFSKAMEWPEHQSVVDGFGDRSIKEITAVMTSVGFSSPPAWLRPYRVLSKGQQFRCDLARAIIQSEGLIVFDEFTSLVDRQVAKIGANAVAKAIRRANHKFVAVTCHYDILEWLEVDWWLDMTTSTLNRRRLRRPSIQLNIRSATPDVWPLFAKHHYLDHSQKAVMGSVCFVGEIEGQLVAFACVRPVIGKIGMRRISRIVVLPDFQGIGIGSSFLNAIAELTLEKCNRVRITTGHPAMKMALQRSSQWRLSGVNKYGQSPSFNGAVKASAGRSVATFEFCPCSE